MAHCNEKNLKEYYKSIFPFDLIFKWLSYGSTHYFARREFAYTLLKGVFVRYQSFYEYEHFTGCVRKEKPMQIDIGAVYNLKPREARRNPEFYETEKEIVFDLDISDYDDARTCCTSADICKKCWKFMEIACKIMDAVLREDFGFKHLLWMFSGRRGIHCWVCDKKVRLFDIEVRSAVVDYLNILKYATPKKRIVIKKKHFIITRALRIITPYFKDFIIIEQNILGIELGLSNFLKIIDEEVRYEFEEVMRKVTTSEERWNAFLEHFEKVSKRSKKFQNLLDEIYLHYCYPRMDVPVSKSFKHLLKSPFSIHPKNGKISVPFDPKLVAQFDPNDVPTISLLLNEKGLYDLLDEEEVPMKSKQRFDKKRTSLLPYITIFEEFLNELLPTTATAEAIYN